MAPNPCRKDVAGYDLMFDGSYSDNIETRSFSWANGGLVDGLDGWFDTVIVAYTKSGDTALAVEWLSKAQCAGLLPDIVTSIGVIDPA